MNKKNHLSRLKSTKSILAAIVSAGIVCSIPSAYAASTWSGGGLDGNFATAANWVGGVAPATPYSGIIMSGNTNTNVTFSTGATFAAGAGTTAGLLFDSTTSGSFAFGGSAALVLSGTGPTSVSVENSSGLAQIINNNTSMAGATRGQVIVRGAGSMLTFNGTVSAATYVRAYTSGVLRLNGAVIGGADLEINGDSTGVIELNGINTYASKTLIANGMVKISHDALLNTNGALGKSVTNITMGASTGFCTAALLTSAAVLNERGIDLVTYTGVNPLAVNKFTIGGASADVSTFFGNVTLGTANQAATALTLTAAAGGRVNITGNLNRATGATGTADTLTKKDAGIVAIESASTVSNQGVINVNVGTLLINGTLATNGANVAVANAATLGGNGTINRSVSVSAGGILSAGDMSGSTSQVGTLTLGTGTTSGLSLLDDTSKLKFDLQQGNFTVGSGINDLITVAGQLTLDGILTINELGGSLTHGTYRLFNYTGVLTDNGLDLDAAFLAAHPGSLIDTSIANQINLVVPEPSTWALLAFGLTAVAAFRRHFMESNSSSAKKG